MIFSDEQQRTLRAAMDRIIPPDDVPSAWEAGAGSYLLRQLEGDLRPMLPLYRDGLDALTAEAFSLFGAPFADLDTARQDLLLRRIELGALSLHASTALTPFFRTLINHTAEGYYSDPDNGGNQGTVAWKMIGFEVHERERSTP